MLPFWFMNKLTVENPHRRRWFNSGPNYPKYLLYFGSRKTVAWNFTLKEVRACIKDTNQFQEGSVLGGPDLRNLGTDLPEKGFTVCKHFKSQSVEKVGRMLETPTSCLDDEYYNPSPAKDIVSGFLGVYAKRTIFSHCHKLDGRKCQREIAMYGLQTIPVSVTNPEFQCDEEQAVKLRSELNGSRKRVYLVCTSTSRNRQKAEGEQWEVNVNSRHSTVVGVSWRVHGADIHSFIAGVPRVASQDYELGIGADFSTYCHAKGFMRIPSPWVLEEFSGEVDATTITADTSARVE
ncbi:hypothetical protein K438DRAFT_1747310 [Mycena galopus ATCC 62051]|nr:hypothetical protein K438DRAFT_1747310 [Mycena galopus ATCC 62051]